MQFFALVPAILAASALAAPTEILPRQDACPAWGASLNMGESATSCCFYAGGPLSCCLRNSAGLGPNDWLPCTSEWWATAAAWDTFYSCNSVPVWAAAHATECAAVPKYATG